VPPIRKIGSAVCLSRTPRSTERQVAEQVKRGRRVRQRIEEVLDHFQRPNFAAAGRQAPSRRHVHFRDPASPLIAITFSRAQPPPDTCRRAPAESGTVRALRRRGQPLQQQRLHVRAATGKTGRADAATESARRPESVAYSPSFAQRPSASSDGRPRWARWRASTESIARPEAGLEL